MSLTDKAERKHLMNLQRYGRQIKEIYAAAVREAAAIGASVFPFDPSKPFSFRDYPQTHARVNSLLSRMQQDVQVVIVNGVESEWTLSNNKNNELANRVFGSAAKSLPQSVARQYYSNNETAREAFLARKINGLELSDRVWKYTNQFQQEIEMGLDLGIRNGLSAENMARDLRQYLNEPEKLFRRVRDEHGQLQLSKNAAAYNPGAGVYRSSHKNAVRLARTETNMAYRTADQTRWEQLDFVVGIEIHRSNNPYPCSVCQSLTGKYPKNFSFTGWHPNCRCFMTPVLKTTDEIKEDTQKIINGEETNTQSKSEVTELPNNYRSWVVENKTRIDSAKSLPFFLRDNRQYTAQIFKAAERSFVMDASSAEWVKERGFTLNQKSQMPTIHDAKQLTELYNSSPLAGYDIQAFDDEFTKIFEAVGGKVEYRSLDVSEDKGRFSLWGNYGGEDFRLTRAFRMDNGIKTVHHDLFEIPKGLQGQGISKSVFKSLYEQYKKADVQMIDVYANIDVGGYTWARYGFCAERSDVERIISRRWNNGKISQRNADDALKIIDNYYSGNKSASKFPMNLLAEKEYGKKLLLGTNWDGYLDLRDETQRAVFERYLLR